MAFTPEKQVEIDRLSAPRLDEIVTMTALAAEAGQAVADAKRAALEARAVEELKCRVNIVSVGDTVVFAPENDYTADDIALIQAVKPRGKWIEVIPKLLARAQVLRDSGMTNDVVVALLSGDDE